MTRFVLLALLACVVGMMALTVVEARRLDTALLALESKPVPVPDWPSLNEPANAAAEVLIRARGNTAVFKQRNARSADNMKVFPKFTGRQSYAEQFQEWPTEKAVDTNAELKSIAEYKRHKFLGQPAKPVVVAKTVAPVVVPTKAPVVKALPPVKATPLAVPIPAAAVPVATSKTAAAPSTDTKPWNLWTITLIICGSLMGLLCFGLCALALSSKARAAARAAKDVQVDQV